MQRAPSKLKRETGRRPGLGSEKYALVKSEHCAFHKCGEGRARACHGRWRRGLCDAVFGCGRDLARTGHDRFYNHINRIGLQ